jgi:citrate lyase beta subunit
MVIYQFIPVAAGRVMERLIRSMGPGTMAVLDLEDGYLDVRDSGRTGGRRARGREQLLELCANAKGRTNGRAVAMRVNVAGSEDFARDLPVVRAASETFGLASVMLPKVESAEQLRRAHADLSSEGVEFGDLVPMVETRKGMDRILGISFGELFRSDAGVMLNCLKAGGLAINTEGGSLSGQQA